MEPPQVAYVVMAPCEGASGLSLAHTLGGRKAFMAACWFCGKNLWADYEHAKKEHAEDRRAGIPDTRACCLPCSWEWFGKPCDNCGEEGEEE